MKFLKIFVEYMVLPNPCRKTPCFPKFLASSWSISSFFSENMTCSAGFPANSMLSEFLSKSCFRRRRLLWLGVRVLMLLCLCSVKIKCAPSVTKLSVLAALQALQKPNKGVFC